MAISGEKTSPDQRFRLPPDFANSQLAGVS
jgi:hypothetical protein